MCLTDWILQLRFKNYKIHRFFEIVESKKFGKGNSFCGFSSIPDAKASNDYLRKLILSNEHYFVARTGGVEAEVLCDQDMVERHTMRKVPEKMRQAAQIQAGMFSNNKEGLHVFFEEYKKAWQTVTHYAYWQIDGNKRIIQRWLNKEAKLLSFHCLKAICFDNPYLTAFEGKRVLVVSPFYRSIELQYKKREMLFPHQVLPKFDLLTYCPVMTYADCKSTFPTWKSALNHMFDDISKIPCDIVVLSCGAYGLPLGAMLYKEGYNVLHIGGMTQCWFGIGGRAYDRDPDIAAVMNEYWTRPSKEETPPGANKVEGGNYW